MDIILADDHKLVRDGLTPFLEELGDDVNVIEAAGFDDAINAAKQARNLKLIILDLGMPGMNGLTGVRQMMERFSAVPLVILSGTHDQTAILKAFNLGIAGFIPKSAGSDVMMSALQLVMAGERYIPSQILVGAAIQEVDHDQAATALANPSPRSTNAARFDKLSKREQHVLELLAGGMTNKEIARAVDLQEATIKIHVKNIYRKMGVNNRVQAVRMVIQPDWCATNTTRLPN